MAVQTDPDYFEPIVSKLKELKPVEMKILFIMYYEGKSSVDADELHEKTGYNKRVIRKALKNGLVRDLIKRLDSNSLRNKYMKRRQLEQLFYEISDQLFI